jgi:hypothetical protein
MLASVAEFYEDDVNTHLANLVALIEPAILIFMAILIAFILVALYLPMFSLVRRRPGVGIDCHEHNRPNHSHSVRPTGRAREVAAPGGAIPLPDSSICSNRGSMRSCFAAFPPS